MEKIIYSVLILCLWTFCSISYANTIFVAGDSTAAAYEQADHQGWGALLQNYFDPTKTKIDNRARGGRSARTFISEGLWQQLIDDLSAGDIVIIQFGHNDASPINDNRRARGSIHGIGKSHQDIFNLLTQKDERVYSFGYYLRQMIDEVKAKRAIPVLVSLTVRNIWQAERVERGSGGWGDFLAEEIGQKKYNIVNRAIGGFSSRTFYTKGQFHRALYMMSAGDTLLIQFGHNDAAPLNDEQRARGTIPGISEARIGISNLITGHEETVHSYGWYLRQMIGEAKARGIRVVVCSPVPRKIWDGKFISHNTDSYPQWAQQVARQSKSDFVDLYALISEEYERLGKRKVDALFADKHTHTSRSGAKLNAIIAARQLRPILGL